MMIEEMEKELYPHYDELDRLVRYMLPEYERSQLEIAKASLAYHETNVEIWKIKVRIEYFRKWKKENNGK